MWGYRFAIHWGRFAWIGCNPRFAVVLRGAMDSYTMRNALVQQGALPSTGVTSHNNYFSLVLGQQFTFSPAWFGSLVLNASALHLTQTRNVQLGFALAFPFTTTRAPSPDLKPMATTSSSPGSPTSRYCGTSKNIRSGMTSTQRHGSHTPRFGVNFIHEPVLSGALTATAETLVTFPQDPTYYLANPEQFPDRLLMPGKPLHRRVTEVSRRMCSALGFTRKILGA